MLCQPDRASAIPSCILFPIGASFLEPLRSPIDAVARRSPHFDSFEGPLQAIAKVCEPALAGTRKDVLAFPDVQIAVA